MEIYPLGTVTFVISENHTTDGEISDELASLITENFVEYFKSLLAERNLSNSVTVTKVRHYRGCITIVVSLSIVAAAAGGWAVVEFFKNYKEVREGLEWVIKDLKNARAWVSRKLFGKKALHSDQEAQLPPLAKDSEELKIAFQRMVEQYEDIKPEYRKYWQAGQEITVVDETGTMCKLTIAVKREDLTFPDESAAIEDIKKVKKKKEKKK